ncbi:glycosyltransferase [Sagittula sp. SSi028]|uniref:glycosyltransferase n=1 Tax=Sagittula sp. SSi028 TaxID=3400636 RepID=UPI003AF4CE30
MTQDAPPEYLEDLGNKSVIYIHPRSTSKSHVNAISHLITDSVAITKQPFKFLRLALSARSSNRYIVAGNLDFVAIASLLILAAAPGRYILHLSSHKTNIFHKSIIGFYLNFKGASLAFVTNFAKKVFVEQIGHSVSRSSHVVYHTSETCEFAKSQSVLPPWHSRYYDVIFFGRLNDERGLLEFLDIPKKLTDLKFAVAGSGPLVQDVLEAETALSNLDYLGNLSDTDAKFSALANSKILFSNMKGTENFGISILEALASGTAVSCPRDYGPEEILGLTSPYLREPSANIVEKCSHVRSLLVHPPKPSSLKKFDANTIRKTWESFLRIDA